MTCYGKKEHTQCGVTKRMEISLNIVGEAIVRYNGVVYISLYDSNIDEPTKSNKWVRLWDYLSPKDLLTNGKLGFKSVGEVEQMGSKFESVSLYGPSGTIVMDATSLGANEMVNFQGVGSFIEETDVVVTTIQSLSSSMPLAYRVDATVMNGYIDFYVTNTSSSFLKEAIRINYKIIK